MNLFFSKMPTKIKKILFWLISFLLLSFAGLVSILTRTDPFEAKIIDLIVFYSLVFVFIFTLATLTNYFCRVYINRGEIVFETLITAIRQGILSGLGLSGLLLLSTWQVLNLFSASIFALIIILLELYLKSRKKDSPSHEH